MTGDMRKEIDRKEQSVKRLPRAAEKGQWEECVRLIEQGAPLNVQNKYGNTLLHLAVIKNQKELCQLLLRKKADRGMTNRWNLTPYLLAVYKGFTDIQEMLF